MSYYKKQPKHTRTIILNTDDANYVDGDRKTFTFRFAPINIEDESLMYVKSTVANFKTTGLAVKSVQSGLFLGSTATFSSTYSVQPAITFASQDGKGSGASAIGLLAPSGLSGSATSSTLSVNVINAGSGYTGVAGDYVVNAVVPTTGGSGSTITSGTLTTATGSFSPAGTLVAGSGYTEVPLFVAPVPPASVPATFNSS